MAASASRRSWAGLASARCSTGCWTAPAAGQSAVLVIRGEAGVGKTALLRHCAAQASGFRVARIAGVESEMELPFAGLHRLCAPMLGRLDALPEPQQDALRVAFGLRRATRPTGSWSPWPR